MIDTHPPTPDAQTKDADWTPVAPLGDALPVRLLRAREAIMQFYRPLFRSTGITERQWRVLRNLYDEPFLEPSEVPARAFMQPPNVSRVLNELQALGYVERVASGRDQRRAKVSLTETGRAATARIGHYIEQRSGEIMKTKEAAEFARLTQLLDNVIAMPLRHPELTREVDQPPAP